MEEKSRVVKRRIYTTLAIVLVIVAGARLAGGLASFFSVETCFFMVLGACGLAIPVYVIVKALLPVKPVKVLQKGLEEYLTSPNEKKSSAGQSREIYNSLRNAFQEMARFIAYYYLEIYADYGKIEKFVEKGYVDGQALIKINILENVRLTLANVFQIYDENIEYIYNLYNEEYPVFERACEEIVKNFSGVEAQLQYRAAHLESQLERNRAYRTARKDSRGIWVGGGFGLSGAIKGAIEANVLNATSGLAHEAYNSLGDAFDTTIATGKGIFSAAIAGVKKAHIYSSQKTKNMLYDSILDQVFVFHYVVWNILCQHSKVENIPIQK